MWLGFAIKHVGRNLAIGAGVGLDGLLATESGRKIAKVVVKSVKAAGAAAVEKIQAQRKGKRSCCHCTRQPMRLMLEGSQ